MTLHLFEGFGIELEYMIVDAHSLDPRPLADRLLIDSAGQIVNEVERGDVAWNNELCSHVIEIKSNGPVSSFNGIERKFQSEIIELNERLAPLGARLLPTGMHPWLRPQVDTSLWPHDDSAIYEAFDRIFDCRGHGWANLQSTHLNLPFCGDEEFARLHAAIRVVLPLLPALCASTPYVDGKAAPQLDHRLAVYADNARRIPSVTGSVIPERAWSKAEYEASILKPIYRDLAPFDPDGELRYEWVNARGAIARFDRDAIEIRTMDIQECPRADIAYSSLVAAVIEALVEEAWVSHEEQASFTVDALAEIHRACVIWADDASIADPGYLRALGVGPEPQTARALWCQLRERVGSSSLLDGSRDTLDRLLVRGSLAHRLRARLGERPAHEELAEIYGVLSDLLARGELYED